MLKKQYILIIAFMTSITIGIFSTNPHDTSSQKVPTINPKKVVITWDLHDVLIMRKKGFERIKKLFSLNLIKSFMNRNLLAILKEVRLLSKTNCSGERYIHIAQKYNNPAMEQLIRSISYDQPLMMDTIDIVKKLHSLGFDQAIASNIWPAQWQACVEQNPTILGPDATPLFIMEQSQMSREITHEDGSIGTIEKPNICFYTELKFKNSHYETIIFIDDKIDNVKAARSIGIDGIHFINAQQLESELALRGIFLQTA